MDSEVSINFARLKQDVQDLARIGREEGAGIYRMAFSEGDLAGRQWLRQRLSEAGIESHMDGAANIHARVGDQDGAVVMTGSHIDTVPGAGHLDGALGVLAGMECLRRFKELGVNLRRPVELVAFSDEEGRFGGMFGSQALTGKLTPEWLHQACDRDGVKLLDVIAPLELNADTALEAALHPDAIHAFVELHIEQGPVLDRNQVSVAAVEAIVGLFRWHIRIIGRANHAGTTPMDMRADAFMGLAEFANEVDRIMEEHGGGRSVATIGRVELFPGAANVIPERAEFTLEARDTDTQVLANLADAFRRTLSAIARRRDLMFEFDVVSEIDPVQCDAGIIQTITDVCDDMGLQNITLPSGAAHDTQMLASITRAGMIFVPSKDGRSHSSAEWTAWEDIERGANVLFHTLHRLAG